MTKPVKSPASSASASPALPQNPLLGIGLKVGSVCVFVAMSSLLKAADGVPSGQLVFFRSFFAIFPIILVLAWQGELATGWKTNQLFGHIWRGLVGVSSMALGFYALTKLPLPESIAINYATPLIIVVFSAIFLRETVRLYRWSAVTVGLIGVLIIMWPRLTVLTSGTAALDEAIGAVAALLATFFAATAMMLVRRLVFTERSSTIVLYFSITSTLFALFSIPFGWVWPTPEQWVLLVSAGVCGGIAQILLTECYRHADMSVIAPFEYSSLILSLLIGYLAFSEIPTVQMLVGGVIVMGAGIFIILREHRLGLDRVSAKKVSTPQG